MKERPILFSAPMVRAILEGRKTMMRRAVKPQSINVHVPEEGPAKMYPEIPCPYGVPGDKLWVRETWAILPELTDGSIVYRATDWRGWTEIIKWRPSIHMPRWASRITLEITEVRVERLQEISVEDCQREGISDSAMGGKVQEGYVPQTAFSDLWDSINGKKYPWDSNPF